MKKTNLLVLSAAAALLATSCSKDQVTQSNPGEGIRFNVLTGVATKATEVSSSNLFSSFKVHARYGTSASLNFDEVYTNTAEEAQPPVWSPEQPSNIHYWPSSTTERVKFIAYSPTTLSTDFAATPGAPLTITVPSDTTQAFTVQGITPNLHASLQKDLVVAQMSTAKPASSNAVTLKFHHVFSQIELQASCGDPNMRVTVYGAKIHGFTIAKSNLTWKDTRVTQISNVWSNTETSSAMAYMVGGTDVTPVILDDTPQPIMGTNGNADGNFMIIPQNLSTAWDYGTNGGAYIAVLCKIEKNTATQGEPVYEQIFPTNTAYKYGFTAVPFSQQFQIGKKYTYKLQFFTNGGGGGVTPPDPIDPTDPDNPEIDPTPITPVLAPMTFTVSVNDWTNGTTNPGDGNLPLQ